MNPHFLRLDSMVKFVLVLRGEAHIYPRRYRHIWDFAPGCLMVRRARRKKNPRQTPHHHTPPPPPSRSPAIRDTAVMFCGSGGGGGLLLCTSNRDTAQLPRTTPSDTLAQLAAASFLMQTVFRAVDQCVVPALCSSCERGRCVRVRVSSMQVEEAGGKVTDTQGNDIDFEVCPSVLEETCGLLKVGSTRACCVRACELIVCVHACELIVCVRRACGFGRSTPEERQAYSWWLRAAPRCTTSCLQRSRLLLVWGVDGAFPSLTAIELPIQRTNQPTNQPNRSQ